MGNGPIRSPVYGPFEVIGELKNDGRVILSLPFTEVAGCNVVMAVTDNYAGCPQQSDADHLFPGVELSIWGAIGGFESCLRRTCVHMLSGPINKTFEYADGYDTVIFRAQNMCGGSLRNGSGIPPFPTQAAGFSLKVSIYIMPRSGFSAPGDKGAACAAG